MIKLYQFASDWRLPNLSPFCMKIETYLRMCRIPYEIVICNNPRKAPKGKLPYITDNEITVADSSLIIAYLKQKYGDILDHHLTPKEQGLALAIQRMLEESLYWVLVYSRWIDEPNWQKVKRTYFKSLSPLFRPIVAHLAHRTVKQQLYYHGMGRHRQEEIYQIGQQTIDAIAHILGEQHYLLGDTPSSIDAACYAFLANIIISPLANPVQQYAQAIPELVAYCQRMQQRFYPQ